MPFKLSSNIALQTPQRDRAVEFYRKVMGLDFAGKEDESVALKSGEFWLCIDQREQLGPILEFLVPDLDEAQEKLLAAGCQVVRWEGKGKARYLRDPFGFVFNLWEETGAFSSSAD